MPEGVKEFGSCKATTEIDRSSSNQILCLVIHPKSLVCDPSEFICQDRVPCLFCFCLLVCLIFIIIDRWTEATAFHLLVRSECLKLKPSKADNRTAHCRRHYQTCKSLLRSYSRYLFPSHRPRRALFFSLSAASLRHKEAPKREDLQQDSKMLSPVATIHCELESWIHVNEVHALYYEPPEASCSSNPQLNASNSVKHKVICKIQIVSNLSTQGRGFVHFWT